MTKKLILFSGGVESTALLTIAAPDDILITINKVFSNSTPSFQKEFVDKVALYFGKQTNYCTVEIPSNTQVFVHQIQYFFSVASLWVAKDPSITEVWNGTRNDEIPKNQNLFDRVTQSWDIMFPNVKFTSPLGHLTKQGHWNLIPEEIRPSVKSCTHAGAICCCCQKCLEHKRLII
jgi:7-cyano-7-deazaguanine synthase in queuosine biosynthesis